MVFAFENLVETAAVCCRREKLLVVQRCTPALTCVVGINWSVTAADTQQSRLAGFD